MAEQDAEVLSQKYNIVAMVIFCVSRFICTFLLRFFSPGRLLMSLAIGGFALTAGAIFIHGIAGLYCLVGISACMSLMFPTIYGIALQGLGEDAKIGAAGLIMAILGGSVLPPLQGAITDLGADRLPVGGAGLVRPAPGLLRRDRGLRIPRVPQPRPGDGLTAAVPAATPSAPRVMNPVI